MVYQYTPSEIMFISIILGIIYILVLFAIGIVLTIWRASNQGLDPSYQKAILLSLTWLIIDFLFWGLLYATFTTVITTYAIYFALFLIFIIVRALVKILIGGVIASKMYNLAYRQACIFVAVIVVILFVIGLIIDFVLRPIIWNLIL